MIKQSYLQVRTKTEAEPIPYTLLLLADETKEAIDKYLADCILLLLESKLNQDLLAVAALYPTDSSTLEIKNIAVSTKLQRKGLGSYLVQRIIDYAKQNSFKKLIVGTADHSYEAQNFYQKLDFKPYYIRQNFFLEEYSKPIIEHGRG